MKSINKRAIHFSLLVLLLVSFQISANLDSTSVIEPNESPGFIRFVDKPNSKALQVSIVRYKSRTGGDRYVDLVGAVHVGDKKYYQNLNQAFKNYDAVLYELVAPEDTYIPKGGIKSEDKGLLSSIQTGMKDVLGLTYQMEEVDYTPQHFVHADFSPAEFKASMDAKGESIFSMVFNMWRAGMAQQLTGNATSSDFDLIKALISDDRENALKLLMAKELANSEGVMSMLEGSEGSTIVAERNKKALSVLRREMQKPELNSFAIFYGAAHLADFHQRLVNDFDMVPVSTQWLDAWALK